MDAVANMQHASGMCRHWQVMTIRLCTPLMLRISSSRLRRKSISWWISFTMASSRLSSVDMSFRLSFFAIASQSCRFR